MRERKTDDNSAEARTRYRRSAMRDVGRWLLLPLLAAGPAFTPTHAADISAAAEDSTRSLSGYARDQGVAGSLRLDYFRSSKLLDDATDFVGATTQVKAAPTFTNHLDGKIEARLTNPDIGNDGDTDLSLLEGYISANSERAQLRIGKQIVAWGRADGINPTDNLTPRNFLVLLPFEDDQRVGTTAAKLDVYLSQENTLTLFTTPYFEPSKVPLAGATFVEAAPDHRLSNSEVGIKLDKTGGSTDGSVSYYHGFSLLPELRPLGITPAGAVFELHYPEIDVLGADMARNFGRYGFRAEAAYIATEDRHGEDPVAANPFFYLVAGVDRTFLDNLNVNVQLVGRWVRHYTDPTAIADPLLREAAVQNAITFGQQDPANYGLTSRISKKWLNDTLEAELLAFAYFGHASSYLRPLVTYALDDHMKITLGGEWYRGADDTFFGRYRRNSGVFTELRYGF